MYEFSSLFTVTTLIFFRRNFRKLDAATLKLVATRILAECLDRLVYLYVNLANRAELAVRLDRLFNIGQITAVQIRQSFRII